ncbi:MAG: FAD-binding protein [Gammaproteobacteria bacterium]|nr:FAD-binding protein [Gammaproteobacteria bacterium]
MSTDPGAVNRLLPRLISILGSENVLTDQADVWPYGYDNSRRHSQPDIVALPVSHEQVKDIVLVCFENNLPVVARGRGTGTTGASVPLHGGIVLSLERMTQIKQIDVNNRVAVVEPGITNQAVQNKIGEAGFFWPPDPTSAAYSTIGGNLACNAAGPRAIKYGTPRENTLGLKAVTGKGEEISTGVYTTKGVVGYDLTRLILGSEGTLAIITEATLKMTPLPQSKRTLQAIYKDIRDAALAVSKIMAQPVIPYTLEFIDGQAIDMVRKHSNAELPTNAGALLIIEVDGQESSLDDAAQAIKTAATNSGLLEIKLAKTQEEIDALWATRKALSPALRNVAPNKINEDVVVPVSNIPALIDGLENLSKKHDINIVNFGHAGNGNIHTNLLIDSTDKAQVTRSQACLNEVFDLVLKLNGTLSGEHGVGIEKMNYIDREIDPITLKLMKDIKTVFDPHGILNPGKMFPS